MVTATMDGTNMSLYLNGELLVSAAQSVKPSDIAFELGSVIVLGGSFFPAPTLNAVLDESGLWTYAMTAAQVAELYAATDKDRIDVDNPVPPATSDSSVPATSEKPESETSTTTKKPSEWEKGSTPMIDEPGTWGTGLKGQIFWDEKEGDTANWVKGFSGKGLDTGGHLRYNLRYAPDTVASADSMTLSTWIYWRGAGLATDTDMAENGNGVVLFGLAGANGHLKVVLKDPDQGGKGGMTFAGGLFDHDAFAASETALPTNEWAMVTVTLDGENMSLYLNGKLLAKTAQTVRPKDLGLNMVRVGSSFWGPPTLNAVLDETAFWSRALSAEEVADMYTDMTAKAPSTGVVNTTGVVMFATAAVSLAAVIALMKKKKAQF